ncbi:MAG: nucleotidyltransferase domain-containing protein [Candidatus Kuenenbacteria bacterium]
MLLFGSYAWGKPSKHSDIDLVVISPDFKKKEFSNRLQWLSRMRDDFTCQAAIDIIGYTPKEFFDIEKHSAIMAKAKKHGKWIYQN